MQREDIQVVSHGPNFEELFVDPERNDRHRNQPKWITVKVLSAVPPKQCGAILKHLSQILPLKPEHVSDVARWFNLSHLRRVRRYSRAASKANQQTNVSQPDEETDVSSERKRAKMAEGMSNEAGKGETVLEILLCEEFRWENLANSVKRDFVAKFELDSSSIENRVVPGRPAESKEELDIFNNRNIFVVNESSDQEPNSNEGVGWWPSLYFHASSKEHKMEKLALSTEDFKCFELGMNECLVDAAAAKEQASSMQARIHSSAAPAFQCGAIVMCPKSGKVLARASCERQFQFNRMKELKEADASRAEGTIMPNPLQTSILLAIQGVSRTQRSKALATVEPSSEMVGVDSGVENARKSLKYGQYLCTGLDVYTTIEPPIYEAMALLHSRVSRVIYGASQSIVSDPEDGGFSETAIHSLPGANHSFRAFRCMKGTSLYERCCDCHSEKSQK